MCEAWETAEIQIGNGQIMSSFGMAFERAVPLAVKRPVGDLLPPASLAGIPIVENAIYPPGLGMLLEIPANRLPVARMVLDWRTGELRCYDFAESPLAPHPFDHASKMGVDLLPAPADIQLRAMAPMDVHPALPSLLR